MRLACDAGAVICVHSEGQKTGQDQEISAIAIFGGPKGDGGPEKILAGFSIKKEEHHDPKN